MTDRHWLHTLAIERAILDRYRVLSTVLTERVRQQLVAADPQLDPSMAFHLSRNWGNADSRELLSAYYVRSRRLVERGRRECRRIYRAYFVARGQPVPEWADEHRKAMETIR